MPLLRRRGASFRCLHVRGMLTGDRGSDPLRLRPSDPTPQNRKLRIHLLCPRGPLYRHRGGSWKKTMRYAPLTLHNAGFPGSIGPTDPLEVFLHGMTKVNALSPIHRFANRIVFA